MSDFRNTRVGRGSSVTRKGIKVGAIVRYVGDVYPELAGMEGEVVGWAPGGHYASGWPLVRWPHKMESVELAPGELRVIRGYSKSFARKYPVRSSNPATIDYGRFANPMRVENSRYGVPMYGPNQRAKIWVTVEYPDQPPRIETWTGRNAKSIRAAVKKKHPNAEHLGFGRVMYVTV